MVSRWFNRRSLQTFIALVAVVGLGTKLTASCDVGDNAAPLPLPSVTSEPSATETVAPVTDSTEAHDGYLASLRNTMTNLYVLMPEIRNLLENPKIEDGLWGVELQEMAGGLGGIFDQLVARDPPDDWARYHLTLVSTVGSTAEFLDQSAESLINFEFMSFTSALAESRSSLDRLGERLAEYKALNPGWDLPPSS